MYTPPPFRERDPGVLVDFVRSHSFATLISDDPREGPLASHLPLEVLPGPGGLRLFGHLAGGNPQALSLDERRPVLAIFRGPHAYISPRWYQAPDVPTWDYAAVHVRADVALIRDRQTLLGHLTRQVARYEATTGQEPFDLATIPRGPFEQDLAGVIGFELTARSVEASFKLSQNRPEADQARVIAELERRNDPQAAGLATLMRSRRDRLR